MKISVIIPLFNAEKTVETTVNSVLNQTIDDTIEIIIVNDGSTDNSRQIVESVIASNSTSIPITLINKKNDGVSSARNVGVENASGEYIAYLDSDDIWHPKKLETLIKIMVDNNIDIIGHAYTISNDWPELKGVDRLQKISFLNLLIKNFAVTPSIVLKKSIFEKFNEEMSHTEDHELWLRLALKHNIYYLDQALVKLGRPELSQGGLSSDIWKMRKGEIQMFINIAKHKKTLIPAVPALISFSLLKHVRKVSNGYMKHFQKEGL